MREVDSGESDYIHKFDDGYSLEIAATERKTTYQFMTKDGKQAKRFTSRDDPRELSLQTAIGKEIKKHIKNKYVSDALLEKHFEKLIIKLSEWVEEIIINKNEAHKMAGELAKHVKEDQIEEGHKSLAETKYPLVWSGNIIDWLTAGERMNILYAWIAYCSQVIMGEPISVIAIGEGGSGKTHIVEVALNLLPKEFVMTVKSTTEAALFGFCDEDPYQFDGKIVNIGDMGGKDDHAEAQDFKNAMKELQTDGYMMRIKMVKNPDGDGHVNKKYELFGKPCVTYTNIPGFEFDDQEKSRSVMLTPRIDNDEAVSEFKDAMSFKANRTAKLIQQHRDKIPVIQNMVLALRELNTRIEIINPYRNFIFNYLKKSKYLKRDVDKIDGILKVITLLNGYNRPLYESDGNSVLFTTKHDIYYLLDLLQRYHESITINLSPGASDVLDILRANKEKWDLYEEGISINDFMFKSSINITKNSARTYFYELNAANKIKVVGTEGRSNIYQLVETDEISKMKKDVEMNELDIKKLEFNYDDVNLDEYETQDEYYPPDTVWDEESEPYWNDLLPEKRGKHGS